MENRIFLKKEDFINLGLIIAMILVIIVLVVGLILTLSVANSSTTSKKENYSSKKSFSNLLWIYVLSLPVIIVLTVIAIFIFY